MAACNINYDTVILGDAPTLHIMSVFGFCKNHFMLKSHQWDSSNDQGKTVIVEIE